jgi:hypothetical protein
LLAVLDTLADKIWIPHQVALEFYRNRLTVIGEQIKRFSDVKKLVTDSHQTLVKNLNSLELKKRHSVIDPAPLLAGYQLALEDFQKSLDNLLSSQQKLTGSDHLRDRIEALFSGKVGEPINSQEELALLYKQADERFKLKIPPGYMDDGKDEKGSDEYLSGGLIHKRKYGDFVLWNQLLSYAKRADKKSIIFITDDTKEDWWWQLDVNGEKTIGPRPELRDEAKRIGGVDALLMYGSETFLKYAAKLLEAEITVEALDEVREVSSLPPAGFNQFNKALLAVHAVISWAKTRYSDFEYPVNNYLDFVAKHGRYSCGFEVIRMNVSTPMEVEHLRDIVNQSISAAISLQLQEVVLAFALSEGNDIHLVKAPVEAARILDTTIPVRFVIGAYSEEHLTFSPLEEFLIGKSA